MNTIARITAATIHPRLRSISGICSSLLGMSGPRSTVHIHASPDCPPKDAAPAETRISSGPLGSRYHAPPNNPHAHLHAFITILRLVVNVIAFVCIYYYFRGRNWARIAVLLTSILSILSIPFQLRHQDTPGRVANAVWALLGVFFLYWLNTRSVREFFKRPRPPLDKLT
jgi:hypothetical protein